MPFKVDGYVLFFFIGLMFKKLVYVLNIGKCCIVRLDLWGDSSDYNRIRCQLGMQLMINACRQK